MEAMDSLLVELIPILKLLAAMILGMLLGMERSIVGKKAGMRTFALVSLGSCLFVLISEAIIVKTMGLPTISMDPLRMASGIVTGVGFLGAGMIIYNKELRGLTTAASLWVAAGIGTAVGFGLYTIAVATTLLTLFVFTVLWFVESFIGERITLPERSRGIYLEEEKDATSVIR